MGVAEEFSHLLDQLTYGKRLPQALYVHRSTPACREGALGNVLSSLCAAHSICDAFNVVKLRRDAPRLSFLSYPGFDTDPHPVLAHSLAIDLKSGKTYTASYLNSPNPPILHRKELLLSPDDPRYEKWAALSHAEENAGLYQETSTIGLLLNWNRILLARGLAIEDYVLLEVAPRLHNTQTCSPPVVVQRHRTAITRYTFSKPVKSLLEFGVLKPELTFFDYGCGHGTDVESLRSMGFQARGWDPAFASSEPKIFSDIVNLGFVLNVIEDPAERADVLAEAWSLAKSLLVVSVMVRSANGLPDAPSYQDGIITGRNTFQRYFSQQEAQQYIEDALGFTAIPLALGVYYVFRRSEDHQGFLQRRSRRAFVWEAPTRPPRPPRQAREKKARVPRQPAYISKYEVHSDLLEAFWSAITDLGRLPEPFEFNGYDAILAAFGSSSRALKILLALGRQELYEKVKASRREDLTVYLACANLRRRIPFSQLPLSVQVDIREAFGTYKRGLDEGMQLLFTVGDPTNVMLASEDATVGWQDSDALYCHSRALGELPPLLRVYVGCAELLYGEALQSDVVKLHKTSSKVSFLNYEHFDRAALPRLLTRTKVNLRTLSVEVYNHSDSNQILYFKERLIAPDDPDRQRLAAISDQLRQIGVRDDGMIGPNIPELIAALDRAKRRDLIDVLFNGENAGGRG